MNDGRHRLRNKALWSPITILPMSIVAVFAAYVLLLFLRN
jgi:hypothetical protein